MANQYKKITIKYLKKYFKEQNCILLSNKYINAHKKLKYICSCGNEDEKNWNNFKNGQRCTKCRKEKLSSYFRHKYEYVYNFFRKEGCKLISKSYKNCGEKLKYKCSCGNIVYITFDNFSHGHRCKKCGKEKLRNKVLGQKRPSVSIKMKGNKNPAWNNGSSFKPYPLGWNKTFKEQIRYKDGYKCQLCGKPEIENNRKLDVHHIDYDKDNIELDNLISLCRQCHLKTNTNRNHWEKYFKQEVV